MHSKIGIIHCLFNCVIVLSLCSVVASCTFESDEEFFNERVVPVTEIENRNFSLINERTRRAVTEDTIRMWSNQTFRFTAEAVDKVVRFVEVQIDGTTVEYIRTGNLEFDIDPAEIGNGLHPLKIRYGIGTGSGSLADQARLEVLVYEETWTLAIDLDPPSEVRILSTRPEEGYLTIRWEPYDRYNFQAYRLEKFCPDPSAPDTYVYCDEFVFEDQNISHLVDKSYLQGAVYYRMVVKAADQFVTGQPGEDPNIPLGEALTYNGLENGDYQFNWGPPTLTTAFGSYRLFDRTGFSNSQVFSSARVDITSFTLRSDDVFGETSRFLFTTLAEVEGAENLLTHQNITVAPGVDIAPFGSLITSGFHNLCYQTSERTDETVGYLFKTDINTFNRLDSISFADLGIPPNADRKTVFTSKDGQRLFLINQEMLYEIDPITLTTIDVFNLGTYDETEYIPKVAENGFLIYPEGSRTRVMDLAGRSYINIVDQGVSFDESTDISPNGQYLVDGGQIYEFNGTAFEKKVLIDYFIFEPRFLDNDRILYYTREHTGLYSIASGEKTELFDRDELTMSKYAYYDPVSNSLGNFWSTTSRVQNPPSMVDVLSLDDFSIQRIRVKQDGTNRDFEFERFRIVGDRILYNQGKYLSR